MRSSLTPRRLAKDPVADGRLAAAQLTAGRLTAGRLAAGPLEQRQWRAVFAERAGRHVAASAEIGPLAASVATGLAASLPTFQLGEMGTGSHLLAAAQKAVDDGFADPAYVAALQLFVTEEQEHARLLALVCRGLDIPMIDDHWTDQVFQHARRIAGLRAEVLMLLVAEVIAFRFYRVLADGVGDPALAAILASIHEDERVHLDFHADTLPAHLDRWPRPVWHLGRLIWATALVGSSAVVAWDHRRILRACGSGSIAFFSDVLGLIRRQVPRFFVPAS